MTNKPTEAAIDLSEAWPGKEYDPVNYQELTAETLAKQSTQPVSTRTVTPAVVVTGKEPEIPLW